VTLFEGQALGLACLAAAIVAGGLAIFGRLRSAAAVNGALAALFLAKAAPDLILWAVTPDAYIRQYGSAALNEIPFTLGLAAMALIALTGSALSFVGRRVVFFWVSWLVNLPIVALLLYLAFWFRIF
jgi:hypothetical protein